MSTATVNQKENKAVPVGSGASNNSMSQAVALKSAYRRFNDRMKTFMTDIEGVYGHLSKSLGDTKRQMDVFLRTDPARMRIAHLAWPLFNKHRSLIDNRDVDAFFKYDLTGLESKGKLDIKSLWGKASDITKEAMWRAAEDLLDLLDEINKLRPIPLDDDDDSDPDALAQKKNRSAAKAGMKTIHWHEALDDLVPLSSLPTVEEDTEDDHDDHDDGTPAAPKAAPVESAHQQQLSMRALMTNLKDIIGGDDPSVDDDFEALMSKLTTAPDGADGADESKTTPQDQETMTRILHHFIDKISPAALGGDDEELEGKSEKEKESEMARRAMEEIRLKNELKYAIGKLTDIESLQQTNDPEILENEKQELAAETERMNNPEKNREYTITSHFNHKLLLFLNKMHNVRGQLKSKKDGRILFPGIKNAFAQLLKMFKENPATEAVIKPVGTWVVEHKQQLLDRDDRLFLEPNHPFLVEMNAAALWSTFKPHERVNFWTIVGHPLQLATIFHHLDNDDLRDIADIVNDLLAAGKIAYDRDPSTLNGKQVITKAIKRGCTTNKIAKIKGLFGKMQKEKDGKTLKGLARLMQDVLPQAAGLRSGKLGHNEDDDDIGNSAGLNQVEVKAQRDRAEQMQDTFNKILASMPKMPSLIDEKQVAAAKNAPVPTRLPPPPASVTSSSCQHQHHNTAASSATSSAAGAAHSTTPAASAPAGSADSSPVLPIPTVASAPAAATPK
jgi:hypothetical protein